MAKINSDLRLLRSWSNENKMLINVNKTRFINFEFKVFFGVCEVLQRKLYKLLHETV